jgi:hypothetical protein
VVTWFATLFVIQAHGRFWKSGIMYISILSLCLWKGEALNSKNFNKIRIKEFHVLDLVFFLFFGLLVLFLFINNLYHIRDNRAIIFLNLYAVASQVISEFADKGRVYGTLYL